VIIKVNQLRYHVRHNAVNSQTSRRKQLLSVGRLRSGEGGVKRENDFPSTFPLLVVDLKAKSNRENGKKTSAIELP